MTDPVPSPRAPRSRNRTAARWADAVLPPLSLTPRQWVEVERRLQEVAAAPLWHGALPVLLLERCWLRLSCVGVEQLLERLPPDGSRDAPELLRWRELNAEGLPAHAAQQQCWQEFGAEACQAALHRFWRVQELGDHGWNPDSYLRLLNDYRRRFALPHPRSLPLLVLARADERDRHEPHRLHWLTATPGGSEGPMRHTCA